MATFQRYLDIYLGATRGSLATLFTSRTDTTPVPTPVWIERDKFLARFHILDWPTSQGAEAGELTLPGGDSLVLVGKDADDPDGDFLFESTPFSEVVFDSTKHRYEALVDLNTVELIAAIDAESSNQLNVRCAIQERNSGNTERFSFVWPIIIQAAGISGDEGTPTNGTPPYPSASAVVASIDTIIGLTGGGSTKLDGLTTGASGLTVGAIRFIDAPGEAPAWRLRRLAITTSSAANPTTITTAKPHGFIVGQTVAIGGHSLSGLNGATRTVATVPSTTTFTVAVLGGGTGGYVTPAEDTAAGIVRPDDFDATVGLFWQSLL